MFSVTDAEHQRLEAQVSLDARRTAKERNTIGQFATPPAVACDIARYALSLHGSDEIRFLEPSCGTGAFFSALLTCRDGQPPATALGVELDPAFAEAARELWAGAGLDVLAEDFIEASARLRTTASLLLANPPYVRHHHLDAAQKRLLGQRVEAELGLKVSGLAGLYVYFLLLSHRLLAPGAISAWLIPSEFMDVNYGVAVRTYLTRHVTLLRIHRFDPEDVQFDDALVSSAIVVFENGKPAPNRTVTFTQGGTLTRPRHQRVFDLTELDPRTKWSRLSTHASRDSQTHSGTTLGDLFKIRRGVASGANDFFIRPRSELEGLGIQPCNITPILPSPRHLHTTDIPASEDGWPTGVEQLGLIDTRLTPDRLAIEDPALAEYFARADALGVKSGYLVRQRDPWYVQELRQPAPFLCTYMGRGTDEARPFRFIANRSRAIATNMYLMLYPNESLRSYLDTSPDAWREVHQALLALTGEQLRDGGRVYGGGLHKIEPKELAALSADTIVALAPDTLTARRGAQAILAL